MSHPMWVRGLKHQEPTERVDAVWVAPYVGAWIETQKVIPNLKNHESRTLCGCVD